MVNTKVLDPIISRVRTDISAVKGNGQFGWRRHEPITEQNLKEHLSGGTARGVCPIKEGETTTMLGLLDLDSHDGKTSWEEMTEVAKKVCAEFKNRSMNPVVWRSSGGRGIHIFILWSTPQDAYSVMEFLKEAINALGYKKGTAGVANNQIEVFPKQDSVDIGRCGSQFILPLAGQSVPLRSTDLELMDREYAVSMDWPVSPPVPVREKPVQPSYTGVGAADLDSLRTLLEYISPNMGYDSWFRVGVALHNETGGGEEGLALWDEWSQQGDTYPGYKELEYKWSTFHDVSRPATIGTLIYLARQNGYKEDTPRLNPNDYSGIARKIIDAEFRSGNGEVSLLRLQGVWFDYRDGCYQERDDEAIRAVVHKYLDSAKKVTAKGDVLPFYPNPAQISAVVGALETATIEEGLSPPIWLSDDKGDPHDYVAMKNGLLHISSRTLLPHTPEYFTLNVLPFDYEADGQPVEWLKFLDSIWEDDQESKETLQEMMGYLLTADNRYQKMFLLLGPKRSGKGTISRIVNELLGTSNVSGASLSNLTTNFGVAPLIGKLAAIIPDARIGGKANKHTIVEKLLMISGGDKVDVDRKNQKHWSGVLKARIVMMTNEIPQLGDSAGALASRFIVLKMYNSFYGIEDHDLKGRLLEEMPQIFSWALDGLERLRERGRFIQPLSAASDVEQLEELNSPLLDFVNSHCDLGPEHSSQKEVLYQKYLQWCREQGYSYPKTLAVFARDLKSAFPKITPGRPGTGDNRKNVFYGIRIKALSDNTSAPGVQILSLFNQTGQTSQGRQGYL